MLVLKRPRRRHPVGKSATICFLFAFAAAGIAQSAANPVFAARAEKSFRQARIQFDSTTNDDAAWKFARACFDLADCATNDTQRATIARQGIAACQKLLARDTNSGPAHYYLAMNEGQLAQAEAPSLASYRLVRQMEREFKAAADLDPSLDYAGPERGLGLLYRDAPGWPFSIGSRRKARDWLERAAKLAPDFPENRLTLAESHLRWNDPADARKQLDALAALWPSARTNFIGEAWEQSWADWSARRDAARKKLAEISAPARSPRNGGK
jgi:tetratricopeptide (TPR) repeat protein